MWVRLLTRSERPQAGRRRRLWPLEVLVVALQRRAACSVRRSTPLLQYTPVCENHNCTYLVFDAFLHRKCNLKSRLGILKKLFFGEAESAPQSAPGLTAKPSRPESCALMIKTSRCEKRPVDTKNIEGRQFAHGDLSWGTIECDRSLYEATDQDEPSRDNA